MKRSLLIAAMSVLFPLVSELPCAAARLDDFVDNGDGTITDTRYGWKWEKKIELDGVMNYANPADADNRYSWAGRCSLNEQKLCQPTPEAAAACLSGVSRVSAKRDRSTIGCDECLPAEGTCFVYTGETAWSLAAQRNAANFGGHSDWRLPSIRELKKIRWKRGVDGEGTPPSIFPAFHSLANCGSFCVDVNNPACSCTNPEVYWSANTAAKTTTGARIMTFIRGVVSNTDKAGNLDRDFVRLVRGPAP